MTMTQAFKTRIAASCPSENRGTLHQRNSYERAEESEQGEGRMGVRNSAVGNGMEDRTDTNPVHITSVNKESLIM